MSNICQENFKILSGSTTVGIHGRHRDLSELSTSIFAEISSHDILY